MVGKREACNWQLRTRAMRLGERTRVMGIVNITPDSFSDGGRYFRAEAAVVQGLQMLEEGADILDLGAESTRPGVRVGAEAAVSADEEQARLLPVLEGIRRERPAAVISVDTYKAATARAAVAAGAEIVNDVSGFLWDEAMAATCAELCCGVVLMHTRGRPEEWRTQPALAGSEVLPLVRAGLEACRRRAAEAGIAPERVVLDPGYGFGKRLEENYPLLARQVELLELGSPLLAGLSRKSFLTRALAGATGRRVQGTEEEAREMASAAGTVAAILNGASVVRVHAVRAAVEAAAVADAVLAGRKA